MNITTEWLKSNFGNEIYHKGLDLYNDGRIERYESEDKMSEDVLTETVITAAVPDEDIYDISITLNHTRNSVNIMCDCQYYKDFNCCEHIIAVLIMYINKTSKQDKEKILDEKTDFKALQMFRAYLTMHNDLQRKPADLISVTPTIYLKKYLNYRMSYKYPEISLRIAKQNKRAYVVQKIDQFLDDIKYNQFVVYGKELEFIHSRDIFDEKGRKIIDILINSREESKNDTNTLLGAIIMKNRMVFRGKSFLEFFKLYENETVATDISDENVMFVEGNPELSLIVMDEFGGVNVYLKENVSFIKDQSELYAIDGNTFYHCTKEMSERVFPLVNALITPMTIGQKELATFCSCVLPEIDGCVRIIDNKQILSEYLPDDFIAKFYFDMLKDGTVTAKVDFAYGDVVIENAYLNNNDYSDRINRNLRAEIDHINFVRKFFNEPQGDKTLFYMTETEDIYDFMVKNLEEFSLYGDVFVSDNLEKINIQQPRVSVGLSVSEGVLNMSLDTPVFPREELMDVFESLRMRKNYHRLKNGTFISLEDSGLMDLVEATDAMSLTNEDLAMDSIEIPMYRVPYMESVLQADEVIDIKRDEVFKNIIKNINTVEHSNFNPSPKLETMLRHYQKTGFRWLKTLDSFGFGGILADDMGLGKTVQVLSYLDSVKRENKNAVSLIVCPSSLIINWYEEAKKFIDDIDVLMVIGNAEERKKLISEYKKYDVIVTSYDLLRRDVEEYQNIEFYSCILDEAQYIKNSMALSTKAVKTIKSRIRFALTGTPIENRLSELWSIFDFLMPGYLYSHHKFMEEIEKPIIKENSEHSLNILRKMVSPFILRRLKADVLKELPPKIEHIHRVQMDAEESKIYNACVESTKKTIEGDENINKVQILSMLTTLRRICCDPHLSIENYEGESCKLNACIDLCKRAVEGGHQVLLFSQFTTMLDIIEKRLEKEEISTFTLQGSTPKEKRAELVKRFNNGEASVFLISLKAGGTGLNLTSADIVIHYDPWWNLAAQNQATDRAHRMGQKSKVHVYSLIVKDTIEEKILALQEKKSKLMDSIEGNTDGDIMTMSKDRILDLLK